MDKSKFGGGLICLVAVVVAVLFIWGIILRGQWGYWAVAVPVGVGFLSVLALGFWIGWTMMTTETEPPAFEPAEEKPATEEKPAEEKT